MNYFQRQAIWSWFYSRCNLRLYLYLDTIAVTIQSIQHSPRAQVIDNSSWLENNKLSPHAVIINNEQ